jgi:hypothetical protein
MRPQCAGLPMAKFYTFGPRAGLWRVVSDDPKREQQRARWLRNKRAARERATIAPVALSPTYVAEVLAERDRRVAIALPLWGYHTTRPIDANVAHGAGAFAADVWAARTLLERQLGVGRATPTRIVRWLEATERTHGYAPNSLRPMVYRAMGTIEILETTLDCNRPGRTYWQPYSAQD